MKRTSRVWSVLIWMTATAMAMLFARTTRFGPAIPVWSGHGVHLGDIVAFALAYAWAAILTAPRRTH